MQEKVSLMSLDANEISMLQDNCFGSYDGELSLVMEILIYTSNQWNILQYGWS